VAALMSDESNGTSLWGDFLLQQYPRFVTLYLLKTATKGSCCFSATWGHQEIKDIETVGV